MAITIQPFYNILPAYRPVKFETQITHSTLLSLVENAVVSVYKNATLLVTTRYKVANTVLAVYPFKTYIFEIDIQKFCQDSLAPDTNTPMPNAFAGAGNGVVVCPDGYADYYITISYEGVSAITGLLENIVLPLETSNIFTIVYSTKQHLEDMDLFYYYGTAGFQDGHCLTKSKRTLEVCGDDNAFLSYLSPYNLADYGSIQVKLYDALGGLLSEGIGNYSNPTLTNLFSTNVGVESLKATSYVDGSPNFLDPALAYYTVSFGIAFNIPPWNYIRHTDLFTFRIIASCCGTRSLRLHWLNLLGGVDSYTFNSEKDLMIKTGSELGRKALSWVTGSSTPHDKSDFGGFKYNSKALTAYQLRSRFLSNEDATWLQDLLVSPKVYAEIDGSFVPVIIEDTEQSINRQSGFIRYEITAQLANDLIIQRV